MYIFKMTDEARQRKELPISNEDLAMVEKAYKGGGTHARWSVERR